jgi:hypothetical protein
MYDYIALESTGARLHAVHLVTANFLREQLSAAEREDMYGHILEVIEAYDLKLDFIAALEVTKASLKSVQEEHISSGSTATTGTSTISRFYILNRLSVTMTNNQHISSWQYDVDPGQAPPSRASSPVSSLPKSFYSAMEAMSLTTSLSERASNIFVSVNHRLADSAAVRSATPARRTAQDAHEQRSSLREDARRQQEAEDLMMAEQISREELSLSQQQDLEFAQGEQQTTWQLEEGLRMQESEDLALAQRLRREEEERLQKQTVDLNQQQEILPQQQDIILQDITRQQQEDSLSRQHARQLQEILIR